MPELREGIATHKTAALGLAYYKESPNEIVGMSADMTGDEEVDYEASNGLVRRLDGSEWEVLRGSNAKQTNLLPDELMYGLFGEAPKVAFTELKLVNVFFHERSLLVDLGHLKLQVRYSFCRMRLLFMHTEYFVACLPHTHVGSGISSQTMG
jgi:hypothetical protein